MNLDDEDFFRDAMGDVTPLKNCANTQWLRAPSPKAPRTPHENEEQENFLTRGFLDIIPLTTELEFKVEGVQQGVLDKLRLGKYPFEASLNLLRQPVETCRQSLFSFMLYANKHGLRNLLIIHGKGRDDESHANIVRSYVARWLQEFAEVQTYCTAQPKDGGAGALYVGLRKTDQAREENRERHAKRSR